MALDDRVLRQLIRQAPERQSQFMDAAAEAMVSEIKGSMNTSPPGRAYKRGDGRWHIASIPGYPPNVDTGLLINSIKWRETRPLTRRIQDGVEYGVLLEYGTSKNGGPRPFVGPIFAEWRNGKFNRFARRNLNLE